MAQADRYPTRVFFFCDLPPQSGGETPLCRSDVVYERMAAEFPAFCAKLEAQGVRYVRVMPELDDNSSPIGRGWRSTYHTQVREEVEAKCREVGTETEWLENGDDEDDYASMTKLLSPLRV